MIEEIEREEVSDRLKKAIKSLSPRDRVFLNLYYYEQLTMKEIADLFSVRISDIERVHNKILKELKEVLL